jgi:hypothetical protein
VPAVGRRVVNLTAISRAEGIKHAAAVGTSRHHVRRARRAVERGRAVGRGAVGIANGIAKVLWSATTGLRSPQHGRRRGPRHQLVMMPGRGAPRAAEGASAHHHRDSPGVVRRGDSRRSSPCCCSCRSCRSAEAAAGCAELVLATDGAHHVRHAMLLEAVVALGREALAEPHRAAQRVDHEAVDHVGRAGGRAGGQRRRQRQRRQRQRRPVPGQVDRQTRTIQYYVMTIFCKKYLPVLNCTKLNFKILSGSTGDGIYGSKRTAQKSTSSQSIKHECCFIRGDLKHSHNQ